MKPKELLSFYIEKHLVEELQHLGFRYSRSVPKFSRKVGDFECTFSFSLSKWNEEDLCEFWTMWDVSAKEYAKWYEKQWEHKPTNHTVVGAAEWNIPGWTRDGSNHFTLTNSKKDEAEFQEFCRNVKQIAIPYYERIHNWHDAAERASKELIVCYDKVCDFYLLAGEKEKAKEILECGMREIQEQKHDEFMLLPEIHKRMEKYF